MERNFHEQSPQVSRRNKPRRLVLSNGPGLLDLEMWSGAATLGEEDWGICVTGLSLGNWPLIQGRIISIVDHNSAAQNTRCRNTTAASSSSSLCIAVFHVTSSFSKVNKSGLSLQHSHDSHHNKTRYKSENEEFVRLQKHLEIFEVMWDFNLNI